MKIHYLYITDKHLATLDDFFTNNRHLTLVFTAAGRGTSTKGGSVRIKNRLGFETTFQINLHWTVILQTLASQQVLLFGGKQLAGISRQGVVERKATRPE